MALHLQPPRWMSRFYPESLWFAPKPSSSVYLTFDDGPVPEVTPWVLETLERYQARATFFCVGNNVVQYPEIYQQITDRGHSIGNHTMHHVKGFKTPWKMYVKDVILAQQYIPSSLFRPPYGQLTRYQAKALKQLGYKLIFWDVISYDYLQEPLTDAHANALLQQIRPGSIVLFHDSNKAYLRLQVLLPKVLEYCKIQKYQLNNL